MIHSSSFYTYSIVSIAFFLSLVNFSKLFQGRCGVTKKLYLSLHRELRFFLRFPVPLYAANASFYIILSLFPAAMLTVALLPYIGYSQKEMLALLSGLFPSVLEPLILRIFQDLASGSSRGLLSLTAITAVWSASRGVYCIQMGLNAICRVRENRHYLHRRGISMLYTLLLIAALLLTLVVQGFGRQIAHFLAPYQVPVFDLIIQILDLRELIIFLLLTALFAAVFCVLPNKTQGFFEVLPGATLAALGWLLFTFCFSIYARLSGSYSLLYGSLAIMALAMLWLYVCICILFYGCVFNLRLKNKSCGTA